MEELISKEAIKINNCFTENKRYICKEISKEQSSEIIKNTIILIKLQII